MLYQLNTDPHWFVKTLKERGITGCSGSFINRAMYKRPVEEFETLLPELNRKAWELHEAYPDFFVPGIHVHPDFPELSLEENFEADYFKSSNVDGGDDWNNALIERYKDQIPGLL